MRFMLVSDYLQMKRDITTVYFVCIFIMGSIVVSTGAPAMACAIMATAFPYMVVYSVLMNDEMAGWVKLRETMPVSHLDVVFGRYAASFVAVVVGCVSAVALSAAPCMLGLFGLEYGQIPDVILAGVIGASVALVMLAVALPIVMAFGLNRTVRLLPIAFMMAYCLLFVVVSEGSLYVVFDVVSLPKLGVALAYVVLATFAASSFAACKLYARREY